jgi:probable F420-dependent oxidoreductase
MGMRYGVVQIVDGEPGRGLEFAQATAIALEAFGFDSYWAPDHVVFFDEVESAYPHSDDGRFGFKPDQGLLEPLMVLQAAAAVTTRIRLGTSVEIITERHPVERAKHITTLDHFSGGRFDYGVGIGWSREEYAAVGVPWERRGARADEYIQVMKALWTQHRATFEGEFVSFRDVVAFPKPVQTPHPPVLVGGISTGALRRAARHGDGWYGWKMTVGELRDALAVLDAELAAAGRSREGFRIVLGMPHAGDLDGLGPYLSEVEQLGVDEFVLGLSIPRRDPRAFLERYADALPLESRTSDP